MISFCRGMCNTSNPKYHSRHCVSNSDWSNLIPPQQRAFVWWCGTWLLSNVTLTLSLFVSFLAMQQRARKLQHTIIAKDKGKPKDTNIPEIQLLEISMFLSHFAFGRDLEDLPSIFDTRELMGHRSGLQQDRVYFCVNSGFAFKYIYFQTSHNKTLWNDTRGNI